jgi:hypothetical protein
MASASLARISEIFCRVRTRFFFNRRVAGLAALVLLLKERMTWIH